MNYWCSGMKRDIANFVQGCLICQQTKIEHWKTRGLMQKIELFEWKCITMDFVVGLPKTRRSNNAIWVIMDRLTNTTHFLPYQVKQTSIEIVH